MVVIGLIVAAAGFLATGWTLEDTHLVLIGLVLSLLAVVLVPLAPLARRLAGAIVVTDPSSADPESEQGPGDLPAHAQSSVMTEDDPAAPAGADAVAPTVDEVVFRAGQLVFHAAACVFVAGQTVSTGRAGDLAAGGMLPCERCLPLPD